MKQTPRNLRQQLRDYPIYTIPQAARYIAMPARTLRYWLLDSPRWSLAQTEGVNLLSFQDLAQSYVLDFIRTHVGLSGSQALSVLTEARRHTKSKYPLLKQDIRYIWKNVLMYKPETATKPRRVVNLTRYGQLEIPEISDLFATRIRYSKGRIVQVFPWRGLSKQDQTKPVTIDPEIMSGKLVVTGTRIPVDVIAERRRSGDEVLNIAKDYRVEVGVIERTLRHLGLLEAA
jgi:uncharacterized protein (DUF433 family)